MGKVTKLRAKEDFSVLKRCPKAIVFYGAKWCSACQNLKPFYKRLASRYGKQVKFFFVDTDKVNVDFTSIPVFTSYSNGKSLNSVTGPDEQRLKSFVKELL